MSKLTSFNAYLAIILSSLVFLAHPIQDPDLGWHLAGGKWISEQIFQALQNNTFSASTLIPPFDFINSRKSFWHDYHWLMQIFMFQTYKYFGYLGIIYLFTLIITLTCLVVFKIALLLNKEKGNPLIFPVIVSLAACGLLINVSSIRPQLVSFLFIAISSYILLQPAKRFEGLLLFLLSALLVNIHVYWIFIPFIYFCYRLVPSLIQRQSNRQSLGYLANLIFISMAGFISPYGLFTDNHSLAGYFQNYQLLLEYLRTDVFLKNFITEFLSGIQRWSFTTLVVLTYLLVFARLISFSELKKNAGIHFAALISVYLIFEAVKFSSIFAIFAMVSFLKLFPTFPFEIGNRKFNFIVILLNISLLIKVLSTITTDEKINEQLIKFTPTAACEYLTTLDLPKKQYQILTEFTYGGWCYWTLYEKGFTNFQVTTDGRTQGVPIAEYRMSYEMYTLKENWHKTIIKWNPDFILASRGVGLAHVLPFFTQDWRNIQINQDFAMYQKIASDSQNTILPEG